MGLHQGLKARLIGCCYRLQNDLAKVQAQAPKPSCVTVLYTFIPQDCPEWGITLYLTDESQLERFRPAIVAIMRKLVLALWYVARGEVFDSRKLFNTRTLGLVA